MVSKRWLVFAVVALFGAGCAAVPGMVPVKSGNRVLVAPNGVSLYTFSGGAVNSSMNAGSGPCAVAWSPFPAPATAVSAGDFTVITRNDGNRQWAYQGKPLYYWTLDGQPGNRTADSANGAWRMARK
jgi:predicted lipoprotein with Yx(FWY)xxD motif